MIVLDNTSTILRARLTSAAATTNPTFVFCYGDEPVGSGQATGTDSGALDGTTNVTLVGSPAASTSRIVRSGFIYNADSALVTVIIEYYDGTNAWTVAEAKLAKGATLTLGDEGFSGGSGGATTTPYDWVVALGDETTAITTGASKVTIRAPRAMTLSKIKGSLTTSGSTSSAFDVNVNGSSVFSTTLTIDASEKTSETATTAAVLSTTSISADDELTFDIDTAGTGAKGAKITLVGTA